jgi:hypothetical protein
MNKNLIKHIINPIKTIKGKKVEKVIYHDVFEKNSLEESKDGIHIIAQQIEFVIEEHKKLYVSWNNVDGWEQYTIDCSLKSYVNESEHYEMSDHEYWKDIIGSRITDFNIYGYKEYKQESLSTDGSVIEVNTYKYEPHLIQLLFDNQKIISIANFCKEQNFVPKIPMGDDIWIFFNPNQTEKSIKQLKLDKLI